MKSGSEFEVVLKTKRGRYLPKKILQHKRIPVTDTYSFNASVWIADTPNSNLKPTVNLTLQHNGTKLCFCFKDTGTLLTAIWELYKFVGGLSAALKNSHTAAVREFLACHGEERPAPLNDYTAYTVIQGMLAGDRGAVSTKVDTRTGEIIEECGNA